jgi:hypothetical protein
MQVLDKETGMKLKAELEKASKSRDTCRPGIPPTRSRNLSVSCPDTKSPCSSGSAATGHASRLFRLVPSRHERSARSAIAGETQSRTRPASRSRRSLETLWPSGPRFETDAPTPSRCSRPRAELRRHVSLARKIWIASVSWKRNGPVDPRRPARRLSPSA